jgi:3-(3-hydroxy-phenyl)propionate hydroxylase
METDYQNLVFEYRRAPDQDAAAVRHPVVVVGAGPVGLATAIDLAQHGVPVVLLDDDCSLSSGSRAICFAKRTLEIFERLGCDTRMTDKGVSWNVGKVFLQDELIYTFNLLAESGHAKPAFINLQQYYVEGYLAERAAQLPNLQLRWKNRVVGLQQQDDHVAVTIDTPDGEYTLQARYVVAADGSRSAVRKLMGLDTQGRVFKDRFLIADVKMKAEFPTERWFWFDPPFHPNQSVLLHRQPDNVWRIDFQLGWDADPVLEKQPERVLPRVRALLGEDAEFELEWVSVYTFACQRMAKFRHGRVLFAGDSAHGVSPFGARGANSGVQDADNLAWKLRWVLQGLAPDALLDTYAHEREFAADENILNSSRSTDFITPKSEISRIFRDAALRLAKDCQFARRIVNSGRLSIPTVLSDSPLNTPDSDHFDGAMVPGAPCTDASIRHCASAGWLLPHLGGAFTVLVYADGTRPITAELLGELRELSSGTTPCRALLVLGAGASVSDDLSGISVLEDHAAMVALRYDLQAGSCYLIRPDQHVAARWRDFSIDRVRQALARAIARPPGQLPGPPASHAPHTELETQPAFSTAQTVHTKGAESCN